MDDCCDGEVFQKFGTPYFAEKLFQATLGSTVTVPMLQTSCV